MSLVFGWNKTFKDVSWALVNNDQHFLSFSKTFESTKWSTDYLTMIIISCSDLKIFFLTCVQLSTNSKCYCFCRYVVILNLTPATRRGKRTTGIWVEYCITTLFNCFWILSRIKVDFRNVHTGRCTHGRQS